MVRIINYLVFYVLERETIKKYAEKFHEVIVDIAMKLAESIGSKDQNFAEWPCQFRINKYNFTRDSVGSEGVQVHTDSGFVTLLQEDESVGGLEILDPGSGSYVEVEPSSGTLLVNLGDVAKVLRYTLTSSFYLYFSGVVGEGPI
jgi:2-oxoglutarate-dependent dioxygenase